MVYKLKPLVYCSRVARMKWTDNVRHVWKFCYILYQSFALALFSAGFSFLNVGLCGNQNSLLEFIMYFIIVFPWGLTHGLRFFRKLFSHQYVLESFAGSWHLVDFDSVVVFFLLVIHVSLRQRFKRGCQHPSNKFEILWQVAQNSFYLLLSYFVAQYVLIIVV